MPGDQRCFHRLLLILTFVTGTAGMATGQTHILPGATAGQRYQAPVALRVSGVAPFRFSVASGHLPPGLNLSPADGSISGAPKPGSAGNHEFTILATDAEGQQTSQNFELAVSEEPADSQGAGRDGTDVGGKDSCQPITITNGLRAGSASLQGHATPSKGNNDIAIQMDIIYGAASAVDALSYFLQDAGLLTRDAAAKRGLSLSSPKKIFRKTAQFKNPSSSRVAGDGSFSLDLVEPLDTGDSIVLTQIGCTRTGGSGNKDKSGAGSGGQDIAPNVANTPQPGVQDQSLRPKNTQQTGISSPLNLASTAPSSQSSQAFTVPGTIDWGRVKALFLIGAVFSNQDQQFSQSNVFASFSLDKAWALPCHFGYAPTTGSMPAAGYTSSSGGYEVYPADTTCRNSPGFNTFFETRLTAIPVSSNAATDSKSAPAGNAGSGASSSSQNAAPSLQSLLTNKKTARFDLGGYLPILITRWVHDSGPQALFVAPLAKAGFDTLTDSSTVNAPSTAGTTSTTNTLAVPRLYNFFGGGARLGHYHLHNDRNEAPDPISHLDVIFGKFSNFESLVSNCRVNVAPPCRTRLWRMSFEGLLQIPTPDSFPLYVGFNANVGQKLIGASRVVSGGDAGDDLRFFFGTQLDLGSLVTKLKGTSGSSSSAGGSSVSGQ